MYADTKDEPPLHTDGDPDDPILYPSAIAKLCNRHPSTVRRWLYDKLIKPVRIPSGLLGARRSEVEKFIGTTALEPNNGVAAKLTKEQHNG